MQRRLLFRIRDIADSLYDCCGVIVLNSKFKVALISTGGTIEKTYDEQEGILANGTSVLELMLVKLVEPGVYVAMHNCVLQFPGIVKDTNQLRFMKKES